MQLTIDKKQVGFDLESLLELWASPMPETHGLSRKRILLVREQKCQFLFSSKYSCSELAIFSSRTGGNLLWNATHPQFHFLPGDQIIYTIYLE